MNRNILPATGKNLPMEFVSLALIGKHCRQTMG